MALSSDFPFMPKIARRMATNSSKLNILTSNPSINSRIKMLITIRNTLPPSPDVPEIEILWFIQYAFCERFVRQWMLQHILGCSLWCYFRLLFFCHSKRKRKNFKTFSFFFHLGRIRKEQIDIAGAREEEKCLPKFLWRLFAIAKEELK